MVMLTVISLAASPTPYEPGDSLSISCETDNKESTIKTHVKQIII